MKPRDPALQERMHRLGLRDEDLRIVCTRASGPGGQHVNKVSFPESQPGGRPRR